MMDAAKYRMDSTKRVVLDEQKKYGVAVAWDNYDKVVDIDLQAVIVNSHGMIVDAVYYNNLHALGGAVVSTGDAGYEPDAESTQSSARASQHGEVIWVNFKKMPADVSLIIFVVAAHTENAGLRSVMNGQIKLLQEVSGGLICSFKMEDAVADVDAVCAFRRASKLGWQFTEIDEVAMQGSHFIDILEPTIGDIVRKYIPEAPKEQEVSFTMQKGAVCDFALSMQLRRLNVGIGGAPRRGAKQSVDLDLTAVVFNADGRIHGAITGDKSGKYGISHSGDETVNKARSQAGAPDEAMSVDLLSIPDAVEQVFFVLNVANPGGTFSMVDNAYCRITDQACNPVALYNITSCESENGLIACRIFRSPGCRVRWGFQALGRFCHGPSWKEATKELIQLFNDPPHEVLGGTGTTEKIRPRLSQVGFGGDFGVLKAMQEALQEEPSEETELSPGDRVRIIKESRLKGQHAIVLDPKWHGMVRMELETDDVRGRVKTYARADLVLVSRSSSKAKKPIPDSATEMPMSSTPSTASVKNRNAYPSLPPLGEDEDEEYIDFKDTSRSDTPSQPQTEPAADIQCSLAVEQPVSPRVHRKAKTVAAKRGTDFEITASCRSSILANPDDPHSHRFGSTGSVVSVRSNENSKGGSEVLSPKRASMQIRLEAKTSDAEPEKICNAASDVVPAKDEEDVQDTKAIRPCHPACSWFPLLSFCSSS